MKRLILVILLATQLNACASGPPTFLADIKIGYAPPGLNDWMISSDRPYASNPKIRIGLGLAFDYNLELVLSGSMNVGNPPGLQVINLKLGPRWESKSDGWFKPYGELQLIHQIDQWSANLFHRRNSDWMGDNPRIGGTVGLQLPYKIDCGVASRTSLFVGAPFNENSPELYHFDIECGPRIGGR